MTERPTFSLLEEHWIPVRRRDGTVTHLTLRQALVPDEDVERIVGDVPTQSFAILRLLIGILHRAVMGPMDVDHWTELAGRPGLLREEVETYLGEVADRFDLRHPVRPFFQVADLTAVGGGVSGLEKLIADVPNGAPQFTTRLGRSLERISWAEAARWLVHLHAFDPSGIRTGAVGDPRVKGGKGYPIGTGWTGQIGGIHLEGANLRETLLLNMVVRQHAGLEDIGEEGIAVDLPPWERDADTAAQDDLLDPARPSGPVDLYTWQTRRVRLLGDDDGVTGLVLAQGDRMTPQNRIGFEPMTSWRHSDPQTKKFGLPVVMPRLHDPSRAFWRGLEAVLPNLPSEHTARSKDGVPLHRPPGVVTWASVLTEEAPGPVPSVIRLRAVGVEYGSNNSVIDEIINDTLVLPRHLLLPTAAHLRVMALDAVDCARATGDAVATLAGNLAAAAGQDETDGPRQAAREVWFARLDAPFRAWLVTLDADTEVLDAARQWEETVDALAQDLAEAILRDAGPAAFVGREVRGRHVDLGRAEAWFWIALDKALPHARHRTREETAS